MVMFQTPNKFVRISRDPCNIPSMEFEVSTQQIDPAHRKNKSNITSHQVQKGTPCAHHGIPTSHHFLDIQGPPICPAPIGKAAIKKLPGLWRAPTTARIHVSLFQRPAEHTKSEAPGRWYVFTTTAIS